MKHISEEQLAHWIEHGYVIVVDFLTPEELATAQSELRKILSTPDTYQYVRLYQGDANVKHLPFLGEALNFIAVSPEIVSFVERALRTTEITLVTSHLWGKYPASGNFDQALHSDYRSCSLLYPKKQSSRGQVVTFILYYADVDEELGATYVVSEQLSKDRVLVPDVLDRVEDAELYRHERPVHVRAGSVLIYNMTVFHRASALTSKERVRYSHHITYQADEAAWAGYNVWAQSGFSPEMEQFITQASPRQRELFGFPPPGHEYWDRETLIGIAMRYPYMEMTPYVRAANISPKEKERLGGKLRSPRAGRRNSSVPNYPEGFPTEAFCASDSLITDNYYRGVADYFAAVTGVPAAYILPGLLAYHHLALNK